MNTAHCTTVVASDSGPAQSRARGFTLLEVLVAISIFSFIALGGFRLLNTTAQIADRGQIASENTRLYKRAVDVMASDLRSAINRPSRSSIADGTEQAAFLTHRNFILEFSRGAYGPSVEAARSNAVRIRYLLREVMRNDFRSTEHASGFDLIRKVSPMDGRQKSAEREQLLLQNVEIATIRFMDKSGVWHSQWPVADNKANMNGNGAEGQAVADEDAIPKAVELDIRSSISTGPIVVSIRA